MTSGARALVYRRPSRQHRAILPWARSPVPGVCIPRSLDFRTADCEGRKNLRDALRQSHHFFTQGTWVQRREVRKKCLGGKAGGQQTARSLLVVCSCHGIKNRVPRARGCPAVPQAPGDGRRLRGDPKNSCIFSASYIKAKHKISFERKGFTVNKQTSWKPLHGRANFK